jgi:hypothetical protein
MGNCTPTRGTWGVAALEELSWSHQHGDVIWSHRETRSPRYWVRTKGEWWMAEAEGTWHLEARQRRSRSRWGARSQPRRWRKSLRLGGQSTKGGCAGTCRAGGAHSQPGEERSLNFDSKIESSSLMRPRSRRFGCFFPFCLFIYLFICSTGN